MLLGSTPVQQGTEESDWFYVVFLTAMLKCSLKIDAQFPILEELHLFFSCKPTDILNL